MKRLRDDARVVDFLATDDGALVVREGRRYRELVEIAASEMVHTRVLIDAPLQSGFAYTDAMHAACRLAREAPRSVLCLGGGGGIVARQLERSGVRVDVVERSAAVLALAARHFGLHASSSLAIHARDAGAFVDDPAGASYDAVLVDLFGALEASPLLADRAFFTAVRARLRDGGAIAVNLVGPLDGSGGAMLTAMRALRAAFGDAIALPILSRDERATRTASTCAPRNVIAYAARGALPSSLPRSPSPPPELPFLADAAEDLDVALRRLRDASAAAAAGRAMAIAG